MKKILLVLCVVLTVMLSACYPNPNPNSTTRDIITIPKGEEFISYAGHSCMVTYIIDSSPKIYKVYNINTGNIAWEVHEQN